MSWPVSSPATPMPRPKNSLAMGDQAARVRPSTREPIEERAQARGEHLAGHHRDRGAAARAGPARGAPRARQAVLEAPHEADAVLRDREALVGARPAAAGAPGLQIELVGGQDEARAERGQERACQPSMSRTSARRLVVA